jgi:hypothetical protein
LTEKEFVDKLLSVFFDEGVKVFPDDFLTTDEVEKLELPRKVFIPGNQLFDQFEIISVDGENTMQFNSFKKSKYIIYASRNPQRPVILPRNIQSLEFALKKYEEYVDSVILKIQNGFRKYFPASLNMNKITNQLINKLNLARY